MLFCKKYVQHADETSALAARECEQSAWLHRGQSKPHCKPQPAAQQLPFATAKHISSLQEELTGEEWQKAGGHTTRVSTTTACFVSRQAGREHARQRTTHIPVFSAWKCLLFLGSVWIDWEMLRFPSVPLLLAQHGVGAATCTVDVWNPEPYVPSACRSKDSEQCPPRERGSERQDRERAKEGREREQ